jgi:hypothetical protein
VPVQPPLDGIPPLPDPRSRGRPTKEAAVKHRATIDHAISAGFPANEEVLRIARENAELFRDNFLDWLPDNMHVWTAFAREVIKIQARGYEHYSARTIIEFLRHHTAVTERRGEGWKINNNYPPYLARLFDLTFPSRAGLFSYRETKATQRNL